MWSVNFVLYTIALVLTLISGIDGRVPLWLPLTLVCIGLLIGAR